MSPRDPTAYLQDMLVASADIVEATDGVTLAGFAVDKLRHKAVIRDLEVMGEAAARLPDVIRRLAPEVPWRDLVGMRNKLIHGYFGMDLAVVHHTATVDIPELVPKPEALRERLSTTPPDD